MESSRKHPIIIVGNHAFARYGIRQLIMEIPQVAIIREYTTIEEFQNGSGKGVDSAVLALDYHGNPANLAPPLGKLLSVHPDVRIVLISHTLTEQVLRRLATNAIRAFVLDSDKPVVMKQAIATVMTGGMWISPSVMASIASQNNAPVQLTGRERQVLNLVRQGETNATIAAALSISTSTVEFHLKNVFDKLGARSRTDALFRAEQEALELDG